TSFNETYNHHHKGPSTGNNFYRMDLGNYGGSNPLSVNFVDTREKGFVIYPMPITENSKIVFSQDYNAFNIIISDNSGRIIYTEGDIRGTEFNLGKLYLRMGTYHFNLSNGNAAYSGTFVKFH
ncbi:MAG: T9SS type A sorting domain-containing protein, partial [Bacteroidetes bacterium]|nr:T9SS type A sorting domain-containing protein [Bacteroidota bacterium]